MDTGEFLTQEEINNFKLNENITLQQDIKNIIILAKNELNTIENKVDTYNEKTLVRIKKKLNALLTKIISLRS